MSELLQRRRKLLLHVAFWLVYASFFFYQISFGRRAGVRRLMSVRKLRRKGRALLIEIRGRKIATRNFATVYLPYVKPFQIW